MQLRAFAASQRELAVGGLQQRLAAASQRIAALQAVAAAERAGLMRSMHDALAAELLRSASGSARAAAGGGAGAGTAADGAGR